MKERLTCKRNTETAITRHQAFWRRESLNPPLLFLHLSDPGVRTLDHESFYWDKPEAFLERVLRYLANYTEFPDDSLPRVRPPFSHAAVPALLGCRLKVTDDSIWAEPLEGPVEQVLNLEFSPEGSFADRFESYYEYLLSESEGRFLINNYEIPGPIDLLSALIGNEQAIMLSMDDPELFGNLLLHCADLSIAFSRWQESLTDTQFCWGGKLQSHLWAPPGSILTSDHANILYSPDIYRDFIRPAEARLYQSANHVLYFGYLVDGKHIADDILSLESIDFAHGCEAVPSLELMKARAEGTRFLIKCPVDDIPRYRDELGDAGIAFWSFCDGSDQAERILADLTS